VDRDYSITNWRKLNYQSYFRLFQQYPWQWLVTLTFSEAEFYHARPERIKNLLFWWTRELCCCEHLQVAYWFVLSYRCGHPHLHLLMLGFGRGEEGLRTLEDVNRRKWERRWPFRAKVEVPCSIKDVAKYLAAHNFRFKSDNLVIDCYNKDLLKKTRTFSF